MGEGGGSYGTGPRVRHTEQQLYLTSLSVTPSRDERVIITDISHYYILAEPLPRRNPTPPADFCHTVSGGWGGGLTSVEPREVDYRATPALLSCMLASLLSLETHSRHTRAAGTRQHT